MRIPPNFFAAIGLVTVCLAALPRLTACHSASLLCLQVVQNGAVVLFCEGEADLPISFFMPFSDGFYNVIEFAAVYV